MSKFNNLEIEYLLRYKLVSQLLYFEYDSVTLGCFIKFIKIGILQSGKYQDNKVELEDFDILFLRGMLFLEFEIQKNNLFSENNSNSITVELTHNNEEYAERKLYIESMHRIKYQFDFINKSISKIDLMNKLEIQKYIKSVSESFGHRRLFFTNIADTIGLLGAWHVRYFELINIGNNVYSNIAEIYNDMNSTYSGQAQGKMNYYGFTIGQRSLYNYYKAILEFYDLIYISITEIMQEDIFEIISPDLISYFSYDPGTRNDFKKALESVKKSLKKLR